MFSIVLFAPLKTNAASLPSYSTDDDGEIVVDGEFSEDGEKTTYDEPISVPEFEEIEGDEMQELMKAQKNVEMFFAEEKATEEKAQTR